MFFKRKKSAEQPVEESTVEESTPEPTSTNGPFDISDVSETDSYLDFGSILVKPIPGMKVRMDIEQANQRVVAVSLEIAESRVQLMAFASSKSSSLWPGIREKITGDIREQKGEIFTRDGEHGEELLAKVPQQLADGRAGHVALRFVGVDGPRWFLRAVVGGAAIADEEATKIVDELLRSVVINRGDKPLPPAELLPLNVPSNASTRAETPEPDISRPERGPEITQIG
ncbi:DUF3710 domain-containing protein [Glutamicibacter arilaitensis]|uniref:DUF3710 domain-containing protein n=1 Tax=Glutamicibacter arilaitensis TaxID=256701 RepID=UPI00384EAD85